MPHIVKRGETLGKIARANGITLARLLDANPQFRAHPDLVHVGDLLVIPDEAPVPTPRPMGVASVFARRLASVAQEQHDTFRFMNEADPQLCGQIKKWTEDIGGSFVSCTSNAHPWSAVFVSWCVKEAGATDSEFRFSKRHSVFVHKAIQAITRGHTRNMPPTRSSSSRSGMTRRALSNSALVATREMPFAGPWCASPPKGSSASAAETRSSASSRP